MKPALPNPAWSNCALLRSWDAIEAHVGSGAMPKVTAHTLNRLKAVEYGHGMYGVVMPTQHARGWICKVTSDESEAHLVAVYRRLAKKPDGLVRYGPIFQIPGSRQGRPLYVLWREEAFDVGRVFNRGDEEALSILDAIFDETVPTCRIACNPRASPEDLAAIRKSARGFVGHTGYEDGRSPDFFSRVASKVALPATKAGRGVATAMELAKDLSRIPKFAAVGRTMLSLAKNEILVTDVHDGNFGYVKRGGRKVVVITDPGNVAFLSTKYDGVRAPMVTSRVPAAVRERVEQKNARCAR